MSLRTQTDQSQTRTNHHPATGLNRRCFLLFSRILSFPSCELRLSRWSIRAVCRVPSTRASVPAWYGDSHLTLLVCAGNPPPQVRPEPSTPGKAGNGQYIYSKTCDEGTLTRCPYMTVSPCHMCILISIFFLKIEIYKFWSTSARALVRGLNVNFKRLISQTTLLLYQVTSVIRYSIKYINKDSRLDR